MKTNDIGKVELYPFEITNLTTSMDTNINMLEREAENYPLISHLIKFIRDDMNTFKRHCGLPVNSNNVIHKIKEQTNNGKV